MARNSSIMRVSKEFEKEVDKIYKNSMMMGRRTSKISITKEFAKMGSVIDKKTK